MKTIEVEGVTLHYRDVGTGRPVLLFHAFPLTGEAFAPQLEALSGRYRFIIPDLRGFGSSTLDSDGSGSAVEMRRYAQDGLAILDALGIDAAVIGGVSMGGYIALALLQEDPGRVQALVLVDTQHGADDDAGRQRRAESVAAIQREGVENLVRNNVPKLLAESTDEAIRARVQAMIRSNTPEGVIAATRGMALRPDSRDILARFGGPALVVVGEKDTVTPVEKARKLADLVSGAKLEIIPGAAHLPNLEQPEAFNLAFDAFLSSLPA